MARRGLQRRSRWRSRLTGHRWPLGAVLLLAALLLLAACDENDAQLERDPTSTPPVPAESVDAEPVALPQDPRLGLELVAGGLTAPVDLAAPDDGSGRLFIVEQIGLIYVLLPDGELLGEPLLDLTDRIVELRERFDERGLLGLALHPRFAENGRFFVYYSAPLREGAPDGWDHTSYLSEFTLSADDPNRADPASERVLLQVDQPQFNHNAGHIRFGLDGYLYVPLGDGGGAHDVGPGHTAGVGNGQDRTNLLGSILRIDVDVEEEGRPYGISADNPFVVEDVEGAPEIWAYGLRNPYHISPDREGEFGILIADAGQERFEEVSLATEGGLNFGWNIREGTHCFDPEMPEEPPAQCPEEGPWGEPLVHPVVEYDLRDFGTVIVGAELYRGQRLAELRGMLLFADWNVGDGGAIFVAAPGVALAATGTREGLWEFTRIELIGEVPGVEGDGLGVFITALVTDAEGEPYLLTNAAAGPEEGRGAVYRLVPAEAAGE